MRALVLAAAVALAAEGQPGAIEGIVTAADGRPVAGASVAIVGASESTRTSLEGRFRLAGVPPGTHTVRAGLDGHGRAERPVELAPGTTAEVELRLPFLPFSEAVVVSAAREAQRQDESPAHVTVLTREDLLRVPAAALDEALKQVPSFSLFRRTSSLVSHPATQGVSLRGVGASGTSRTLVRLDGVSHNDPFGNWVYWDSVPQLQVESIEVAPSGLSHLFGSSAMAGVISIAALADFPTGVAAWAMAIIAHRRSRSRQRSSSRLALVRRPCGVCDPELLRGGVGSDALQASRGPARRHESDVSCFVGGPHHVQLS